MTVQAKDNKASKDYLYRKVRDELRSQIEQNIIKEGQAVRTQKELCTEFGVSEITVRRAIRDLVSEGLLISKRGSGTFVLKRNDKAVEPAGSLELISSSLTSAQAIGVTVMSLTDGYPFISHVIRGVRSAIDGPANLQFFEQPPRATGEIKLPMDRIDGMLIHSPASVALIAKCQEMSLPYVLLHNDISDGISHSILIDYADGMLSAFTHLHKRGRRHIAMVTAAPNRVSTAKMTAAYAMACRHFDLPFNRDAIISGGYGEDHGYLSTQSLLRSGNKIDAIIYASDYQAKGGLRAAEEAGLNVPGDLSLVGTGNVLRESEARLGITSIDTHFEEIGRRAAVLLSNQINHGATSPGCHIVPPSLVIKETT